MRISHFFIDRPIFEFRASDPVRAMSVLEQMPEVETTSLFGVAVHAVLKSRTTSLETLTNALGQAGVTVEAVERVTPSLEDVFLDVVDRDARKGAA